MYHHHRHKPMSDHSAGLWVVAVVNNPVRYRSRYNLFKNFRQQMEKAGVNLLVVETALGHRPFECTSSDNPRDVQLRAKSEIWHKENMINIGISRLPSDWKYLAWIDADVEFVRPDWAEETVHQLQHHKIIQMWQSAIDLGPTGEALQTHQGFVYSWRDGAPKDGAYYSWHPGFAWAARRSIVEDLGGLIDWAILGAGDHHMARAMIHEVKGNVPVSMHANYHRLVGEWQERCKRYLKQDIGFMPGTLFHHFHGKKKDRKYWDRWKILTNNHYDPLTDIKKNAQGVYELEVHDERQILLRDQIRAYFRQRNEDSIDP